MESMRRPSHVRFAALSLALAVLGACQAGPPAVSSAASDRELLNSQRIELAFGNFGIEVLSANANLRVSNLFSVGQLGRICRTFAVVAYPERIDPALAEAHARIVGGQPIGETFASEGWSIERRHLYFGEIEETDTRPRVARLMGLDGPTDAAVHVYVFIVTRDGRTIDYATISEVHHPAYLSLNDLESIFGRDAGLRSAEDVRVRSVLETVLRELEHD